MSPQSGNLFCSAILFVFVTHPRGIAEVVFDDRLNGVREGKIPLLKIARSRTWAPIPNAERPNPSEFRWNTLQHADWGVKNFDNLEIRTLKADEIVLVPVTAISGNRSRTVKPKT